MNRNRQEKGITLIALVITILILLILAGISISTLKGSGLFDKAKIAKNKTENAQAIENQTLIDYENQIDEIKEKKSFNIDEHLQVDKKIYIDSNKGSDETGIGTKDNPFSTLEKISEPGIIENDYSYAIILMDGTYNLTEKIFELNCNKEINIFGNKEKTLLKVSGIYPNKGSGEGSTNYKVNLYRLIWNATANPTNAIFIRTKLSLYNVGFKFDFEFSEVSYFITGSGSTYNFENCTMPTLVSGNLRAYGGNIYLKNCYGGFTISGYGINPDWNTQTNYLPSKPQVNMETYEITEDESIWKNTGTGKNPDGTQANLGVYGGEYSWEV